MIIIKTRNVERQVLEYPATWGAHMTDQASFLYCYCIVCIKIFERRRAFWTVFFFKEQTARNIKLYVYTAVWAPVSLSFFKNESTMKNKKKFNNNETEWRTIEQ